jgi:hypothetical protein
MYTLYCNFPPSEALCNENWGAYCMCYLLRLPVFVQIPLPVCNNIDQYSHRFMIEAKLFNYTMNLSENDGVVGTAFELFKKQTFAPIVKHEESSSSPSSSSTAVDGTCQYILQIRERKGEKCGKKALQQKGKDHCYCSIHSRLLKRKGEKIEEESDSRSLNRYTRLIGKGYELEDLQASNTRLTKHHFMPEAQNILKQLPYHSYYLIHIDVAISWLESKYQEIMDACSIHKQSIEKVQTSTHLSKTAIAQVMRWQQLVDDDDMVTEEVEKGIDADDDQIIQTMLSQSTKQERLKEEDNNNNNEMIHHPLVKKKPKKENN